MAISIREVAIKAGVSIGTVSHVLNGNDSARISKTTQERVRMVADELGYHPNRLARSLWRGKTDTIGLMVSGLRNPFFVELLEAAEEAITEAGYQVLVDSGPSVRGTYSVHLPVRNWPVDAALAWFNSDQVITTFVGVSGSLMPTVYLGYRRTDGSDWVAFDLTSGATALLDHLCGRGYQRIGYVSAYAATKNPDEPRSEAYRSFCATNGRAPIYLTTENEEETREAAMHLGTRVAAMPASERPDAIMCHNDVIAIGLICGLKRAGLRVPQDVAVAGFDGIEEGRYLTEPLTTVRTDAKELVQASVPILLNRMRSGYDGQSQFAIIPARLEIGGTT